MEVEKAVVVGEEPDLETNTGNPVR